MTGGPYAAPLCLSLALCVAAASAAVAQIGGGALAGNVVDQAGAAVPGATLTITSLATNLSRTTVTGQEGTYVFTGLPPGTYRVRVELSGFRPLTREGIRLATGETVRLSLQLELGAVTEAVTVMADAPLLRSETSGLGHVIDNRKVVDLPLNGRSFITLASLAPGVAVPPPPAAPFPRINGGRPRTNEYLFDGISVLQPEPGQVAFFPNVDAIQEFKIESNSVPAEFGRFNGGVINLTTKSGEQRVSGERVRIFSTRGAERAKFLCLDQRRQAAVSPQSVRWRAWAGRFDAIRHSSFVDYQGQRQTIGRTVISTVPTLLQRQGIFTEAIAGRVPVIYDPATGGVTRTHSRAMRFRWIGWIRSLVRSCSDIRYRPVRGPPTTTVGWITNGSIRTSSVSESIIGSRRTAIRYLGASPDFRKSSSRSLHYLTAVG